MLALAVSVSGYPSHREQLAYSYLTSLVFWTSLGLGGLFLIMLHHLTDSVWSVVIRRIAEASVMTLPVMGILFIPALFNLHELYHWSHPGAVAADALLQKKAPYLNSSFFIIRTALYFSVWFALGWGLRQASLSQDAGHSDGVKRRMIGFSAPGMILFAVTVTFAAFDWMMSLAPHWYSTIYGVNFFVGSVMAALAFFILAALYLRRRGVLAGEITVEHYNDLAKLMFAFVILWAYMAFSQYFLIWYANIPEETVWYRERWVGAWKFVSVALAVGHFAIPFLVLINRPAKRNFKTLTVMAVWLLGIHWLDIYWNIMPNLLSDGARLSWMDPATFVGVGGVFLWRFSSVFTAHPALPVGDPKLEASLKFINRY